MVVHSGTMRRGPYWDVILNPNNPKGIYFFADLNMPKHPRAQLVSIFQKSKDFHRAYENSMRAAVENVIKNRPSLAYAGRKHSLSKSALPRKVQKFRTANENEENEVINNFVFGRCHGFKQIFAKDKLQKTSSHSRTSKTRSD